ncbi:hypothetical protein BEL04_03830 [Mucilaginibacter sp. PPCGB 2223]|uniref:hypothetical protein n=1 Tax=Mucilaginibacter sp. PPCGB 2223 TaxID=1886027 RepID=UPI000826E29E|nr:hypothetical protein [Mucilaginibacter sp. PPCGB 2223]OCX53440.1 hypothetical protein BEL04_03830 [Mucilaginibacter sp. PPCGB 2223]
MMTKICCFLLAIIALSSCKQVIKPEDLFGKWKYVKVSNPYSRNPDDTVSAKELREKSPSVTFSPNGHMDIISEGKILSQGKYRVEDHNILVTEQLPDGKTRNFPFYIMSLNGQQMIFETKEDDAVRVTAIHLR